MRVTYTVSVVPELASTSWEWCVRSCGHAFQSPFATPPGVGLSSRRECAVGPPQSRYRLSASVPGWELRTAQDPARTPSCGRHFGHVAHARSHRLPLLWRCVSLFVWPGTQLPAAKRRSELRGFEIAAYIRALIQRSRFGKRRGWGGEKRTDSKIRPVTVLSRWSLRLCCYRYW